MKIFISAQLLIILFFQVNYCPAQEIQSSKLVFQLNSKASASLHFNGKFVFSQGEVECLEYEMKSTGIVQISNHFGEEKKWSSLSIYIESNTTYYFDISKKGGIAEIEAFDSNSSLCTQIAEKVSDPIPGMSIEREVKRRGILEEKAKERLVEINTTVSNSVNDYFNILKKDNLLDKAVHPKVEMSIDKDAENDGLPTYNLKSTFTYNIRENDDNINFELINYGSGKYLLSDSKAAFATVMILKQTISEYLSEYFEPGSVVEIRIVGTADSQPIHGGIKYNNPYKIRGQEQYFLADSYELSNDNGVVSSFDFDCNLIIRNEDLAFLRAYGIHDFIATHVEVLQKTRNEFVHEALIEEGRGGSFRRVFVEVLVQDIFRNK